MHIRFDHNMHPCLSAGRGGANLLPNFQKRVGALTGPQFFRGGLLGKRGLTLFKGGGEGGEGGRRGLQFYKKQKLKYEIFNDKKSL